MCGRALNRPLKTLCIMFLGFGRRESKGGIFLTFLNISFDWQRYQNPIFLWKLSNISFNFNMTQGKKRPYLAFEVWSIFKEILKTFCWVETIMNSSLKWKRIIGDQIIFLISVYTRQQYLNCLEKLKLFKILKKQNVTRNKRINLEYFHVQSEEHAKKRALIMRLPVGNRFFWKAVQAFLKATLL